MPEPFELAPKTPSTNIREDAPFPSKIESQVVEKLHHYFKGSVIKKYPETNKVYVELSTDENSFELVGTLVGLIGINPWSERETHTITIDNNYDIELLVEMGILTLEELEEEEFNSIEEVYKRNDDAFTKEEQNSASSNSLFENNKSIPKIFKKNDPQTPTFEGDSEEEREKNWHGGDISYLYKAASKKYKWKNGKLFSTTGEDKLEIDKQQQDLILAEAQAGNEESRSEYLKINMGLVYLAAFNVSTKFPWVNQNDLLQSALISMNKCIDDYEPSKNVKFSTYALPSTQFRLLSTVAKEMELIHIPLYINADLSKIKKVKQGLGEKEINATDVAAALGIDEYQAERLLKFYDTLREAEYVDIEEESELEETQEDSDPFKVLEKKEIKESIAEVLDTLTSREAKIIRLRFGIGCEKHTLEEVSTMFGVTRARIGQIEQNTLRKLRSSDKFETKDIQEVDDNYYQALKLDMNVEANKNVDNLSEVELMKKIDLFEAFIKRGGIMVRRLTWENKALSEKLRDTINHSSYLATKALANHYGSLFMVRYEAMALDWENWEKLSNLGMLQDRRKAVEILEKMPALYAMTKGTEADEDSFVEKQNEGGAMFIAVFARVASSKARFFEVVARLKRTKEDRENILSGDKSFGHGREFYTQNEFEQVLHDLPLYVEELTKDYERLIAIAKKSNKTNIQLACRRYIEQITKEVKDL